MSELYHVRLCFCKYVLYNILGIRASCRILHCQARLLSTSKQVTGTSAVGTILVLIFIIVVILILRTTTTNRIQSRQALLLGGFLGRTGGSDSGLRSGTSIEGPGASVVIGDWLLGGGTCGWLVGFFLMIGEVRSDGGGNIPAGGCEVLGGLQQFPVSSPSGQNISGCFSHLHVPCCCLRR